ncbi:bifunctional glycoside hydrolase 114/ polysaccharide deacetylase family protein [Paludibacterium sp. THUN1379]|nr:bifunctional glycoside hydrolase 114/ polysaccharide deacetylase family protein [Paludibacterium sp. THUN1379]
MSGALLLLRPASATATAPGPSAQPSYAFYYGPAPLPLEALTAFDHVVVEPDSGFNPRQVRTPHTDWLAYTSVGEVTRQRDYFARMPKSWLKGGNHAWDSLVIDQSAAGWPAFFVEQVITPLWQRGYRGFFLDTLDAFQLIAKNDRERQLQIDGLVRVIRAVKQRYPEARLVFNRGFEILPQVHQLADAVAFESLYKGWDQGAKRFTDVPQADRDWLMAQVKPLREQYHLPVIAIDYCPDQDAACARDTVARIQSQGLIPYVTDPGLQRVGIGARQAMPRRVLVLQDPPPGVSLNVSDGVLYLSTPLNYMGYRLDYLDINRDTLPEGPLQDRYAGVVLWLNNPVEHPEKLRAWVTQQIDRGVRVVFIGTFGMPIAGQFARTLGLTPAGAAMDGPLQVTHADPSLIGYEMPPLPNPRDFTPVRVGAGGRSLLHLQSGELSMDAAALMPWGGYVMRPFAVYAMDAVGQTRWVLQPFAFLRQALKLPDMPVPDPTTENGLRLFMSHIDGDGFASRVEFHAANGDTYSGEALYRVLKQYGLPVTVSVIEGEVSDEGPNAAIAPQLRDIARRIFDLPNVEMASHTYTHPLPWMQVTGQGVSTTDYDKAEGAGVPSVNGLSINVPGYRFNLTREIDGSVAGINRLMAPPGKQVKVVLWSGDCQVPAVALKQAEQAGVFNMNGGDTLMTHSNPSLTAVAPHGVWKDGYFQLFAPNQNEEVYTNLWQGPYYGYRRVLETFELTERPRRLKPIDIYYHMFTGTKQASLVALNSVLQGVARQPIHPVFVSEYAQTMLDTQQTSVAQEGEDWLIRSAGELRTVRLSPDQAPDLQTAQGVAGFLPGPDGVYVHLTGSEARFRLLPLAQAQAARMVWLASANGRIKDFRRTPTGVSFELVSHVAPQFTLAGLSTCQVRVNDRPVSGQATADGRLFRLGEVGVEVTQTLQSVHVDVSCQA